jgi:hypothetical protein
MKNKILSIYLIIGLKKLNKEIKNLKDIYVYQ